MYDQKTGLKPTAVWNVNDTVVKCDLRSNDGYNETDICVSESDCLTKGLGFTVDKAIRIETTYTLTCYDTNGNNDTAIFTPPAHFRLTVSPSETEIDFITVTATTEPPVDLSAISWNGYRGDVSFTADLSDEAFFTPQILSFLSDYSLKTSILEIFASYRFDEEKTVVIWGNKGTVKESSVDLTIHPDRNTPIYEPY